MALAVGCGGCQRLPVNLQVSISPGAGADHLSRESLNRLSSQMAQGLSRPSELTPAQLVPWRSMIWRVFARAIAISPCPSWCSPAQPRLLRPAAHQRSSPAPGRHLIGVGVLWLANQIGFHGAAIAGGLSVGLGFGLKEVLSNFVSGLWLLFEGSVRSGEILLLERDPVEVRRLGLRAATLWRDRDNVELVVPNQTFITDTTTDSGTDRMGRRRPWRLSEPPATCGPAG